MYILAGAHTEKNLCEGRKIFLPPFAFHPSALPFLYLSCFHPLFPSSKSTTGFREQFNVPQWGLEFTTAKIEFGVF